VFAALDIQHAMGMRHIVICSALQYSSHDGFGGLVVCVLASGSRVRGFDPKAVGFFLCKKSSARPEVK
jgi:hypothetical protein